MDLEAHGLVLPADALVAIPIGAPGGGLAFVRSATRGAMEIACLGHDPLPGAESRWTFRVATGPESAEATPRVLGRVASSTEYPWGHLVELTLLGASPQHDYDLLVDQVAESGGWDLDWNPSDWTLE